MAVLMTLLFLISLISLIIGLINPDIFKRLFKDRILNRAFILKVFGGATLVLFFAIGIFAEPVAKSSDNNGSENQKTVEEQTSFDKVLNSIVDFGQKDSSAVDNNSSNNNSELYSVVQVVDGDTIKVDINGKTETLRLIGLDTPETVDPRKVVQCFGLEASNKAKEILTGKKVRLEADNTQGELDKYNRLLRYVFLEDGTLYNKLMIAEGYAHEYTYDSKPYKYQAEFKQAEDSAREAGRGLWSATACNGNTTQAAVSKGTVVPTTSIVPVDTTTVAPTSVLSVVAPVTNVTPTVVAVPTLPVDSASGPQVKKSDTDICHEKGTTYYSRTKSFTPYNSIQDCLNSGGRLPKTN